jgi:hypothetical protein
VNRYGTSPYPIKKPAMEPLRTLDDTDVDGKTIQVRADLNGPMDDSASGILEETIHYFD